MTNLSLRIPPALRNRNFSLYWSGILVSMAGSQMQVWALYWHIRTLTDQPIALSIVGLVRFVPILVFSLWGGLIADRLNRRVILYFTQSIMALVAVILGLLTFTSTIQLWHIYVLLGINAAVNSFDIPARQSLVANMVPKGDLPSALSMQSVAIQVGSIIGPALSGVLISTVGLTWVYWINGMSFVAVILALVFMTFIPQEFVPAIRQGFSQLKQIAEGFRFVLKKPIILSGMALEFWASFFSSANTLMPFLARDILHVGGHRIRLVILRTGHRVGNCWSHHLPISEHPPSGVGHVKRSRHVWSHYCCIRRFDFLLAHICRPDPRWRCPHAECHHPQYHPADPHPRSVARQDCFDQFYLHPGWTAVG